MSETRANIWEAGEGCQLEDTSKHTVAGDRPHPCGVVVQSAKEWFRVLWESGRHERVYRDHRSGYRLRCLRVVKR